MGYKPSILFFYSNDDKLEELLSKFPFNEPSDSNKRFSSGDRDIQYEHFRLQCYKKQGTNMQFVRGQRASKIIIEKSLYEKLDNEAIDCCLKPLLCTFGIIGSYEIEVF